LLLVIFQIRSHVYALAGLVCNPSTYASHLAGMTGMRHHVQVFFCLFCFLVVAVSRLVLMTRIECSAPSNSMLIKQDIILLEPYLLICKRITRVKI
jgi:hypothetical protein